MTTTPVRTRTRVGIVGAGPAGLMLAHLLARAGIDTVAVDVRRREEIETTHRAGILERDSVRLLVDTGVSDRVLREGHEHRGIDLRFGGESHRIDFEALVGASTWLYPQTDVFVDLADARERDGGDVRFGVTDVAVEGVTSGCPTVRFTDAEGRAQEVDCEIMVGADGSRGICRDLVPQDRRRRYYREYPFAWFGILTEAPRSSEELIYTGGDQGFALVSSRTETIQRMYFQCDPTEDVTAWSDDQVWDQMQSRVAGPDGFRLREGPIVNKTVLPFRSFVQEPMRHGRLVLAGDAAHTVPPTGAKGLNLALADVRVLGEVIEQALATHDLDLLDDYSERALARVWRTQHFSYWMTTLLHRLPDSSDFDVRRQRGELESVVSSEAGSRYLAEAYTGWPAG
ncbi:MAG: 4-hydroxybenzoate 3-monooxygenase [Nocardioides sp.]|nr:4-hydroxybenzoate 3-monooxygenase [Nocardioides sp.]